MLRAASIGSVKYSTFHERVPGFIQEFIIVLQKDPHIPITAQEILEISSHTSQEDYENAANQNIELSQATDP